MLGRASCCDPLSPEQRMQEIQFPPHPKGPPIVESFPTGMWLKPAVESRELSGGHPPQVTVSHPPAHPQP